MYESGVVVVLLFVYLFFIGRERSTDVNFVLPYYWLIDLIFM